jgi:hypothetical protein
VITDLAHQRRLAGKVPRSWVPWPEEVVIRIEPELITGRALAGGRSLYGL